MSTSTTTEKTTLTVTITVQANATDAQIADLNEFAGIVARDASERLEDTRRARLNGVTSASWEVH